MLFIRGRLVRLLLFGGKRTKRFIRVKKIHSLSALFLVFAAAAYANTGESASIQKTDTTLSEKIEGNYLVRRYKVIRDNDDAQYSLKYSVAASNLSALTGGNATELADLDRFIEGLKRDTSLHVRRIVRNSASCSIRDTAFRPPTTYRSIRMPRAGAIARRPWRSRR